MPLKLLRNPRSQPDPNQLALQLDFFGATHPPHSHPHPHTQIDQPAPPPSKHEPRVETRALTPESDSAPPAGKRRIQVGQHVLDYALCRSKRRTIGFLVDEDGLRITAPRWVTITEIENAIREKQRWIVTKLTERRERSARRLKPQMRWCDGGTLPYLGSDITLRIRPDAAIGIAFDATTRELTIGLPPDAGEQQLKDRVQGWLQAEARTLFGARLPLYAEKLGVQYQSFALSSAATQWGSCTADGRIRLNWRLIHFALPLVDYVIAHELAHLREMNHGPQFWATVQSIFPEFATARKTLREKAPETLPVF